MYAIDINRDIDTEFAELVEPVAVRAPRPRCADGHGTLTHLFFSDTPLDIARAKAICSKCSLAPVCVDGAIARAATCLTTRANAAFRLRNGFSVPATFSGPISSSLINARTF